ncbi:hypothetical protein SAMN05444170_3934 [Bradyrhizobium erythrophlei]|uniref:Uncharacterized protein n=1 Tax=Bradyrhizobium erythrophlei TaxID=1437360 RepID=A0A1M7U893_9BRAD|nr:hypothetical protein SAMN05444170_3934 [Bradyrhizobium erythrophlei]
MGDASRRMEQTRLRTPAALSHPSLYQNIVPRQSEGAGNAGRSDRTRSFVCRKTHVVTTGEPRNTAFPARMVLTVSFVLSPEIGLVVSVPGAMRSIVTGLMPASRHQDHTTSPSASHLRSSFASQSVHRSPRPTFVTIAKRPPWWARDGRNSASDLHDGSRRDPAADWHDGQIRRGSGNHVK